MFLDNLSTSLLRFCDENSLTYETASEQCNLSARYFGNIVRRKATPSVVTLEKICIGLETTPNDLLLPDTCQELSYRHPLSVSQIRRFHFAYEQTEYPICPRCGVALEREYQNFCDRCGQCLDWASFGEAALTTPEK